MCKKPGLNLLEILVSGISDDTTHDVIKLYFQSPKNNGGPVERALFKSKTGRAVVTIAFQYLTGLNSNVP